MPPPTGEVYFFTIDRTMGQLCVVHPSDMDLSSACCVVSVTDHGHTGAGGDVLGHTRFILSLFRLNRTLSGP